MGWLESRMTLVWLAYFSIAELLSLMPSQVSSCILISEEAGGNNYSGDFACAPMHEAIFRFTRFIRDNANHDNVVAFGTIAVSVFTYTLWRSTNLLWAAGEKQFRLAREEFVSTHRPIIRVRRVFYGSMLGAEHLSHGDNFKIDILITNVGSSNARIVDSLYRIYSFKKHIPPAGVTLGKTPKNNSVRNHYACRWGKPHR